MTFFLENRNPNQVPVDILNTNLTQISHHASGIEQIIPHLQVLKDLASGETRIFFGQGG